MAEKYFCDPERNKECTKEGCFLRDGPCYCTTHPEFAMIGPYGKPVIAAEGSEDVQKIDAWLQRFNFEKKDWE